MYPFNARKLCTEIAKTTQSLYMLLMYFKIFTKNCLICKSRGPSAKSRIVQTHKNSPMISRNPCSTVFFIFSSYNKVTSKIMLATSHFIHIKKLILPCFPDLGRSFMMPMNFLLKVQISCQSLQAQLGCLSRYKLLKIFCCYLYDDMLFFFTFFRRVSIAVILIHMLFV